VSAKFVTVRLTVQQAEAAAQALSSATAGTLDDDWLDQDTSEAERTRVVERAERVIDKLYDAVRDADPRRRP
jgi:hypothetical protein